MFGTFETYEVTFEIYMKDNLVNRQIMKAPKEMLIINFVQLMEQVGNDQRPMRIKMSLPIVIWDKFEQKEKTLTNSAEFSNNAMIAWEEDKKESEVN